MFAFSHYVCQSSISLSLGIFYGSHIVTTSDIEVVFLEGWSASFLPLMAVHTLTQSGIGYYPSLADEGDLEHSIPTCKCAALLILISYSGY